MSAFTINPMPEDNAAAGPPIKVRDFFKYPIMVVFFAFLAVVTVVDIAKPDKAISELENRPLQQAPAFNLEKLVNNKWTVEYGEYTRDQFLLRDEWISLQSGFEIAQGKLENGGVWYADGGYQIAKNAVATPAQQRNIPLNTEAVAAFAAANPGKVSVMIVPSPANVLSEKLPWNPPQMDENGYMDEMFGTLRTAGANVVDLRSRFAKMEAEGDPIYYHTDHHWTTNGGAWAAYEEYMHSMGHSPTAPGSSLLQQVPDFLGTNYSKTKRPGTPPEVMEYYDFANPMTITKPAASGTTTMETTIMDKEKLAQFDKYAAFLHGNNGYSVIEGNGEGSILIIKDSYGNSFAPYCVSDYAKIGIVDLRDWNKNLFRETVAENYDEILVLYSFTSFSEALEIVSGMS